MFEKMNQKGWMDIPVTPERQYLDPLIKTTVKAGVVHIELKPLLHECEIIEPPSIGIDCEHYVFGRKGVVGRFARNSPAIFHPEPGDVIVYAQDDEIRHVGLLQSDQRIISKWGMLGPVVRHPIELVPTSYGDGACFRRFNEQFPREVWTDRD